MNPSREALVAERDWMTAWFEHLHREGYLQ